jgi:hypothetical protein
METTIFICFLLKVLMKNVATLWELVSSVKSKRKAVPLHAIEALGGTGDIAPTHSRPRQ